MRKKNKTLATALALFTGIFGGHRFYLYGFGDWLAWFFPIPTALGLYGLERVSQLGQDDVLSWILLPLLGLIFAVTALTAIVYGLQSSEQWDAKHAPEYKPQDPNMALDHSSPNGGGKTDPGASNWLTIFIIILALMLGTTALMSSLAFGFQRYFEYQIIEAQKISQ